MLILILDMKKTTGNITIQFISYYEYIVSIVVNT